MQATRALRYALSAFAERTAAVEQAGFDGGLAGFVTTACARGAWLRQAIADRRFTLSFQPIVALGSGTIHHYEALLRPEPDPASPVRGPQISSPRRDHRAVREWTGRCSALPAGRRAPPEAPGSPPTSRVFHCRARPSATACCRCSMPSRADLLAAARRSPKPPRSMTKPRRCDHGGAAAAGCRSASMISVPAPRPSATSASCGWITSRSTASTSPMPSTRADAPSLPPWNWPGCRRQGGRRAHRNRSGSGADAPSWVRNGQGWLFGRPGRCRDAAEPGPHRRRHGGSGDPMRRLGALQQHRVEILQRPSPIASRTSMVALPRCGSSATFSKVR